ncbi:MAG TPA: hypothetical protein VJ846_05930 [Sphingomicrobium sp.]|nr:hypothetical protein [Sphingomicrobium sp.]
MSVDAAAADRLPWLADEPVPQPVKKRRGSLLAWAAAIAGVVAAGGFWVGQRSVHQQPTSRSQHAQSSTTVLLPPPKPAAPAEVRIPAEQEVRPAPVPEVHPSPVREVRIPAPPAQRSRPVQATKAETAQKETPEATPQTPRSIAVASNRTDDLVVPKPWNPRVVEGAAGRLVQVGAFGSVHQAKRGWWFMVHDYPAMAHLPAVVRQSRNSKGRIFYRFDVGTTSQAHSEVLCQRMTKVGLSCAVIGLPWKAKVER